MLFEHFFFQNYCIYILHSSLLIDFFLNYDEVAQVPGLQKAVPTHSGLIGSMGALGTATAGGGA